MIITRTAETRTECESSCRDPSLLSRIWKCNCNSLLIYNIDAVTVKPAGDRLSCQIEVYSWLEDVGTYVLSQKGAIIFLRAFSPVHNQTSHMQ